MKKIMLLSAVMGSLISVNAFAHNIQPNQLLANVTVSDKGEITLNGNDVAYKSWSATALPGKVRVIQHIAGRSAAKEKNQAMIEPLKPLILTKLNIKLRRLLMLMMLLWVQACL